MSFEIGAYLLFWLEYVMRECNQVPLTRAIIQPAFDTIVLSVTAQGKVTKQQIAAYNDAIIHYAYGSAPPDESRRIVDHMTKAIVYRRQKYACCTIDAETLGHVTVCCLARLEQFLNQSSNAARDDLSKIIVEDGPLHMNGDFFGSFDLRCFLGVMERAIIIPYQSALRRLFESTTDVLALNASEIESIISATINDVRMKLDSNEKSCVKS